MLVAAIPAHADPSAEVLLEQLKAATGGELWDGIAAITAAGRKTSFGLMGRYQSVDDLRSGRFALRADYGMLANAEGLDRAGRWRMDNSGQVHPLDSDEARTVAVTEAFLARRGYLFTDGAETTLTTSPPVTENHETFDRVEATPPGGRSLELWIRRADHRLDRATIQLSTRVKVIRYGDYRAVGGLMLPFEIQTTNGDQAETGIATITDYRLSRDVSEQDFERPSSQVADASIRSDARVTYAPFALDVASGFPIVLARINGKGPFPFILDTGGHDILTPAAAAEFKLVTVGRGISQGAGAGSTPTKFTHVDALTLGDATLTASPFVVLELDLGHAPGPDGKPAPIAGIIGLEVFERFAVSLDYGAHRVALYPLDHFSPPTRPLASAPIRFTEDMPLIYARLEGRGGWFGVDTGNNTAPIIFSDWAAANGLKTALDSGEAMSGHSVGGSLDLRKGQAGELDIGDLHLRKQEVLLARENMGSLSARSEAGNIGETVVSRFKVTFDYRREIVYFETSDPKLSQLR